MASILAEPGIEHLTETLDLTSESLLVSAPINLTHKRILVVDDSPDNLLLFNLLLKNTYAVIETATNGAEGVEKAETGNYDAIFMDVEMPVMDGNTATRALREHGITKPIVALTAHAMKEEKARAVESGCSHYLCKHIDRTELRKILDHIFKSSV